MALLITPDDQDPTANWEVVGTGRRLAGGLLDLFFILFLASGLLNAGQAQGWLAPLPESPELLSRGDLLPSQLLVVGTQFAYYFLWEALTNRTPGKLLSQTRVMRLDGDDPSLGTVFLRTLVRLVPFEPISFLSPLPGGWHDRWTGTCVVRRTDGLAREEDADDDSAGF